MKSSFDRTYNRMTKALSVDDRTFNYLDNTAMKVAIQMLPEFINMIRKIPLMERKQFDSYWNLMKSDVIKHGDIDKQFTNSDLVKHFWTEDPATGKSYDEDEQDFRRELLETAINNLLIKNNIIGRNAIF